MIRVVIEVRDEATSFSVVAQARNLREAASIAATVYPNSEVRVKFPIDAAPFFIEDPPPQGEIASLERAEVMAA